VDVCDTFLRVTKIGYARVSTIDQNTDAQHDALRAAGCERVFTDHASGKLASRPQLDAALDYLRPGDALVITKLDRLGRSVAHLCDLAAVLREHGVDLAILNLGIDTSTPAGKLAFHMFAGIAEFERELISERTKEGLHAARARGRTGGRKPVMTPEKIAIAQQMYDSKEHTLEVIAQTVGVSRMSLYRHLDTTAA
jgi:DNA invertase Pin-like site-specific DNA recombinase